MEGGSPLDGGSPPDGGAPPDGGGGIDAGNDGGGGGIDAGSDAGGGGTDAGGGGTDAGCTTSIGSTPATGAGVAEAQLSTALAWESLVTQKHMDVSGGYAAVGYQGVFGGLSGKVTIHAWDGCGSWVEQTSVVGSDTTEKDFFGSSLSLVGTSLVVGANYKDMGSGNSGEAYVFGGSGSSWSQTQKITAPTGMAQRFGFAIAQTSSVLVITSPLGKDPSSVVTYTGTIGIWTKAMNGLWQNRDVLTGAAAVKDDTLGYSVAIDGGNIVTGAPGNYIWGNSSGTKGKAWIFSGSGTTWAESTMLTASDGANNDWFGRSVAISGNTVIVGAPNHDSAGSNAGAAYVFTYSGGAWTQTAKLTASDATADALFGFTVAATSATHVLVGAPGAAKIYSFSYANGGWSQDAATYAPCSGSTGWAMGVSGNLMISGKTKATIFDLADPNTACVGP